MPGEDPTSSPATGCDPAPDRSAGRCGDGAGSRHDEVGAEVEIALADLIADADGEVAFFNDSGFRTVRIVTDAAVVAEGVSGRHVTAGDADVSGYKYLRFDNGVTLYLESSLDVTVRRPVRDA